MTVQHAVLENGLQIIGEPLPQARSIAFGFFVRAGARDETEANNGVSHFLEHMAFKGTDRYSAAEVNLLFDEVGAHYNAATGEESTMYYATVLPEFLAETFAVQAAILFPALRQDDFETEKQVILEEIGMYDDQPSFVAYDQAMHLHFSGHPLGHTILGTKESVTALTAEQMLAYHTARYASENIVLAVSGRYDWDEVRALAQQHCGHWPAGGAPRVITLAAPIVRQRLFPRAHLQQQTVCAFCPAPSISHPLRDAADLLAVIVGDDANSRLFWELVDDGSADSAELQYQEFEGAGTYLSVLIGDPEATAENLQVFQSVYDAVNRDGVTPDELSLAQTKLSTRLVLRSERPTGRLGQLGHDWLLRREYRSVEADLARIAAVTPEAIRTVLDEFPLQLMTTVGVGPLTELPLEVIPKSPSHSA